MSENAPTKVQILPPSPEYDSAIFFAVERKQIFFCSILLLQKFADNQFPSISSLSSSARANNACKVNICVVSEQENELKYTGCVFAGWPGWLMILAIC